MKNQNIKRIINHKITAKTTNLKSPNKEITKKTIIMEIITNENDSVSSLDGENDVISAFDNDFSSLQMKSHDFNESEIQPSSDSNWEDYIIHIACGDDIGLILREILLSDEDNPIKDIRKHLDNLCINDASDLELMSGDIEEYETNLQKRRESILEIEKKIRNHQALSLHLKVPHHLCCHTGLPDSNKAAADKSASCLFHRRGCDLSAARSHAL